MQTVPQFPEFRRFTADDAGWYGEYYLANGLNPFADIGPANLLAWLDMEDDLAISAIDDALNDVTKTFA